MQLWRGLVSLFSLILLTSLGFLLVLAYDAQYDLSSRASQVLPVPPTDFDPSMSKSSISVQGSRDIYSIDPTADPLWYISGHTLIDQAGFFSATLYHSQFRAVLPHQLSGLIATPSATTYSQVINGWQITHTDNTFIAQDITLSVWQHPRYPDLVIHTYAPRHYDYQQFVDIIDTLMLKPPVQVLGMTLDQSSWLTNLIRPSVVQVFNQYCTQASISGVANSVVYPFCHLSYGTGFFVDDKGHIATNGHVVTTTPEQALHSAVQSGKLDSLLVDALSRQFSELGLVATNSYLHEQVTSIRQTPDGSLRLTASLLDMHKNQQLTLKPGDYQYTVFYGSANISTHSATLIDRDYQTFDAASGFVSSDIALIKIDMSDTPGLPISPIEDRQIGSDIFLFGFPGVATSLQTQLLDQSSNTQMTVTRGIVSSIKYAKGDQKRLIQTDASINQGNSGGPAVDQAGQVVGIATYGLTPAEGTGNYNFLRDITDLSALADKNDLVLATSPSYTLWRQALDQYRLSYYRHALTSLTTLQTQFPSHPLVGQFITDSQSKLGTTLDKSPRFNPSDRTLYIYLSLSLLVLSSTVILILLANRRRFGHASMPPSPPTFNTYAS
jgi:serine protease Do